jgi:hypothetical protein
MKNLTDFERLAAAASKESAPEIDVSKQVVSRIHQLLPIPRIEPNPMIAFAGFSAAAACLVGYLSLQAWDCASDPMISLLTSVTMVMR